MAGDIYLACPSMTGGTAVAVQGSAPVSAEGAKGLVATGPCYESSIVSPTRFRGNHGDAFKVVDGTLWEVKSGNAFLSAINPEVFVCPDEGKVKIWGRALNVRQLLGCHESSIVSPTLFEGNNGDAFKLVDGTLWEVKYGNAFLSAINPEVFVCPDEGKVKVNGKLNGETLSVQQLSGCHESSIVSPTRFRGNDGEVFKLVDGTLWEVKYGSAYLSEYNPKVIICQDDGKLRVNGKTWDVQQVSGCHESSVVSPTPFTGNTGDAFELVDGTLWEVKYGNAYLSEYNPNVFVCPEEGKVRVKGKTLSVQQLSGCHESSIVSPTPFSGSDGEAFKLVDGTLWEVKYGNAYLSEYNPKVIVCPDDGKVRVNGKTLNVQQLSECYESSISSDTVFRGRSGETVTLADGSIWEVIYVYGPLFEFKSEVVVCPIAGHIKVGGRTVAVRQISGPDSTARQ